MSTFTKKVGCAVASCRKGVLLASVAAMAVSAFAEGELDPLRKRETDGAYSFGLAITGVPDEYAKLSSYAAAYLVNTETRDVVAYFCFGDNTPTGVKDHDMLYLKHGETIELGGTEYNFADQILVKKDTGIITPFDDEAAGIKTVSFKFTYETSADANALPSTADIYNTYGSPVNAGDLNLLGIVYDPGAEGYAEYYQEFRDLYATGNPGTFDINATAAFHNVPEPTSAMLLLLGFAGLALKRKRVA